MSSKRFSLKNLIIVCLLLALTIVMGAMSAIGAKADTRTDAKSTVNAQYTVIKDKVETYNGLGLLDKIKESADYLLDNVEIEQVDRILNEKLAEMQVLSDIADLGNDLTDYVASLSSGDYLEINWERVEKYYNDFIADIDLVKLFSDGNLSVGYAQNLYNEAKDGIDGINTKASAEDLASERAKQAKIMQDEYDRFASCGYYTQDRVDSKKVELDEAILSLNEKISKNQIITVRSDFVKGLLSCYTSVEDVYDAYIQLEVLGETDKMDDQLIEDTISVYEKISSDFAKNDGSCFIKENRTPYIKTAHSRLVNIYRNRQLSLLENSYDKSKYSKYNKDDISVIIEETRLDLLELTNTQEIKDRVATASSEIAKVKTNKATITSNEDSMYVVSVTAVGNPYAFAPTAYVTAEDYTFYAVKKNVNRLLNKIKLDGDVKYEVKYYIDITIIDENGRELKEEEQEYLVTIEISDKFAENVGDDFKVIYYYDGEMDGYTKGDNGATLEDKYISTIETIGGKKVLKFTTTHFSPYAVCGTTPISAAGLGSQPIYLNPFLYIAIILVSIILLIILFICLKHWKYKIVFKNNGGTRVNTIKAKKTEAIVMPKAPTKPGYIFGGWFTDKRLTHRFVQYRVLERKNIKLWAKWIPLTAEVASVEDYYQALRAALDDYERVGESIGLKEVESVARIILSNQRVYLFVCGNVEKYREMGYPVTTSTSPENADVPAKFLVGNEEDLYMGLELIDIAMKSKGFTDKPGDPEIKPITAEERELGFLFSFKNDKVADTLKEWFELLRLEAKSFVLMGDSGTPRDLNGKYIVKAKRYDDRIDLYLPIGNENSEPATGPLYKDVPNKFVIKTQEDMPIALEAIDESMTTLGLKKYPRNASQLKTSADTDTAFGYKVRFN